MGEVITFKQKDPDAEFRRIMIRQLERCIAETEILLAEMVNLHRAEELWEWLEGNCAALDVTLRNPPDKVRQAATVATDAVFGGDLFFD